ncbi:MAG: TldE/PmbA family protein [Candidatus Tectomicrobia bacterium]|nr:TldE/PmbA family protein [Candidatus Tectomicrobia bacterium]
MRGAFERAAKSAFERLRGEEVCALHFEGEESHFVRFSKGAVRQAGQVRQMRARLQLIQGARQMQGDLTLSGDGGEDRARLARMTEELRAALPLLPEDPHLSYLEDGASSERAGEDRLPRAERAAGDILAAAKGRDMAGLHAQGGICAGFASSLGARRWFACHSFNFDWSFHAGGDKAAKARYAGFEWDPDELRGRAARAAREAALLARPERTVPPGRYRAFLSPYAVEDFVGTVSRRGFGLKAMRTRRSSLLRMAEEGRRLSPLVRLDEAPAAGVGPDFQEEGFAKAPRVPLLKDGLLGEPLVSPRSGKEYGVPTNGASGGETPGALDMAGGDLPMQEALARLGAGVYIGDLWYLNYSDLASCRITGLTRFATFWVEGGEIAAPLRVMRFDETAYRVLGENLAALTRERELILDPGTYGARSTRSAITPGALVEDFALTL